MRHARSILLPALLLTSALAAASTPPSPAEYDKPIREVHNPLPPNPNNPQDKPNLSCFYYPQFMVKQVDLGELGAEQISILPRTKELPNPACRRANAKNEMVIDPKTWSGYFDGVKGSFVFLTADDGFNGGFGFAVVSSSDGQVLYIDAARDSKSKSPFSELTLLKNARGDGDAEIILRYRRILAADCSLQSDPKACWDRIRRTTGLTDPLPPACGATYDAQKMSEPQSASDLDSDPSVIAYNVEIVLTTDHTVLRAAPISKALECYPAD